MGIPSIFNDVIGPVMRGPSSSHSAAAVRIGNLARMIMGERIRSVRVEFDLSGSLPTTYLSQGSDMGLCGGLLGYSADDPRLLDHSREMQRAGIEITYDFQQLGDPHPNTYNLTLTNENETIRLVAISTGGGMIELQAVDGLRTGFTGDRYGVLVRSLSDGREVAGLLQTHQLQVTAGPGGDGGGQLIFATGHSEISDSLVEKIARLPGSRWVRKISPVVPVMFPENCEVPFSCAKEMLEYAEEHSIADLSELGLIYEMARGGADRKAVMEYALELVELVHRSIRQGLTGTVYEDRILGFQSDGYRKAAEHGRLLDLGVLDRIIPYITALMEVKSSLGVIVAAPTAGSCGSLPGTVIGLGDSMGLEPEIKARGLLAGGMIGVLIASSSTFSAEVCGCQAECGVASGMLAAAAVTMQGGDCHTATGAASLALQNILGMVCDPVANRVEVPCLGKNIMAAANGLSCANQALAGFDPVIPFDEVVGAMDEAGRAIPHELRCTGLGGLSVTPRSKFLAEKLAQSQSSFSTSSR